MRHSIKTKTLLIAFIVLTTTTALGQANVLVEGYVQGIDTLVQVRVRVPTFAGDYEESVVVTGVERYQYDTQVSYPIGGQVYQTRWRVFMNDTGAYQYRRQSWINGAEQPLLADEFEVGVSYGLPLTKRNWACSVHTASTWYEASSKSSLGLRV
ncbi:MAG TPA: hypothetical protein VN653_17945, partial [Anaerolineales bacterium]|nr:hypothetical protein [Anaerolineales bacterium]